jgi:acyl-coenzyme A thioesterase PaaI-like protein
LTSDSARAAARQHALQAIGLTRARGLTFYGHFVGLGGAVPAGGRARLELAGEVAGVGQSASSYAAVATLADMSLGSAMRSLVSPGALLSTVSLALQHRTGLRGPLAAEAVSGAVVDGHTLVQCRLLAPSGDTAAQAVVGHGQAWFAVLPSPDGRAPGLMPWEYATPPAAPPVGIEDLDEREQTLVSATEAAADLAVAGAASLSEAVLMAHWAPAADGIARGTLEPAAQVLNRAGQIQGGILYGLAAVAAERALGLQAPAAVDGHYQFLRPATGPLELAATTLRSGRSAAFARVDLRTGAGLIGAAQFGFRG